MNLVFALFITATCLFVNVHAQSSISCAFCVSGMAQINQQVLTAPPDQQAQMGILASQGCDQITVKEVRQACRQTMNDNFNSFYSSFSGQADNSPTQMCINMGMC